MTTPQLLAAIIGGAVALASIASLGYQKTRRFKALFWLAIGGTLVFAAFRPQLIEFLGEDTLELRLRLLVALLSFIVLTITLESIRVARMQERYAFLWLATGVLLLLGAVFVGLAGIVTRVTGMPYALIVMVVLFSFIMLMLFSVSLALSRMQAKLADVARALALTEARLRRLEDDHDPACRQKDSRPPADATAPVPAALENRPAAPPRCRDGSADRPPGDHSAKQQAQTWDTPPPETIPGSTRPC